MKKTVSAFFASLVVLVACQAHAAFNLQVTEIWPGTGGDGDDHSPDWFEITNTGDMPWVESTDGALFFDDESATAFEEDEDNPGTFVQVADPLGGISSIAPGESVIFVDESISPTDLGVFLWEQTWVSPLQAAGRTVPQVGYYDGSGLSGSNGDAVALFIDADLDGLEQSDLVSETAYPSNVPLFGRSFDTIIGTYTARSFPGIETGPNNVGQTAIGTPGYTVPEPNSLVLLGLAACGLAVRRRK